jgi:DnaJ homolog subfamily A member 5
MVFSFFTSSSPPTPTIRCHYDVLGVERSADPVTIKKAHRKLALQWHPDKNLDNHDKAIVEFRLVQQAYECLSDPTERRWYDDHREAILQGWSANNNQQETDMNYVFDVMPYMYAGCYTGYNDNDPQGFYAVYQSVFDNILQGEDRGDDTEPHMALPSDFGNSQLSWTHVGAFYQAWTSFTTALTFAWADVYDVTEAPHRQVRRAMQEENRKRRRAAQKERNETILALVQFVKRRDPRVQAQRQQVAMEKAALERQRAHEALRKQQETQQAREQWRLEAEAAQAAAEEADKQAGRIRLADLEEDYDYYGGGGKKKGRGKKGKKGGNTPIKDDSNDDDTADNTKDSVNDTTAADTIINTETNEPTVDTSIETNDCTVTSNTAEPGPVETLLIESLQIEEVDDSVASDADSSSSEEPDVWRCECCRKDFKSEAQMENHLKSKKHKDALKKYEKSLRK